MIDHPLEPGELRQLADLHCRMLPHTVVSRLGRCYAAFFFRYLVRSPLEDLLVERRDGRPVGFAVLSAEPGTLSRRLLLNTPLLLWAPVAFLRLSPTVLRGGAEIPAPEFLILAVDAEVQRRGVASALMERSEALLRARGCAAIWTRLEDLPSSPVISLFQRFGYGNTGTRPHLGSTVQVLSKPLKTSTVPLQHSRG